MIQTCQQQAWNGLLRLDSGDLSAILTFFKGQADALYRFEEDGWQVVPGQPASALSEPQLAKLGWLPMPPEGLRIAKLFLEARTRLVETLSLPASEVPSHLESVFAGDEPGLLRLNTGSAEHLVVIPGLGFPFAEVLSASAAGAQYSLANVDDLPVQAGETCQASFYATSPAQDAWRLYHLRLAFVALMRLLILRFGDLTARAMSQRLCAQLTASIQGRGWEISLEDHKVVHPHVFKDLDQAALAYSFVFEQFFIRIQPFIGARLTRDMREDMLQKLNQPLRELLHAYVQPLRLPELDKIVASGR